MLSVAFPKLAATTRQLYNIENIRKVARNKKKVEKNDTFSEGLQ
jgi:hypothetical protein